MEFEVLLEKFNEKGKLLLQESCIGGQFKSNQRLLWNIFYSNSDFDADNLSNALYGIQFFFLARVRIHIFTYKCRKHSFTPVSLSNSNHRNVSHVYRSDTTLLLIKKRKKITHVHSYSNITRVDVAPLLCLGRLIEPNRFWLSCARRRARISRGRKAFRKVRKICCTCKHARAYRTPADPESLISDERVF